MTSRTYTGGLKEFVYSKENQPRLTQEEKLELKEAYGKVAIRKRREKITRLGIAILITLIVLGYILLK